jgi:hypothetical protein
VALEQGHAARAAPGPAQICLAGELSVGGFMLFEYPEPTTPCILIRSGSDHVTGTPR